MGLRFACARIISAVSTWGLKHVFHRPAANFPGKVALYIDPTLIADLAPRLRKGSIVVVGTNGKTTTTNLLADAVQASGQSVSCNRTGANLDSGVATALLQVREADWGVFESDELWLAKIVPHLRPDYVVLLNLFRDQLDRVGELDRIQDSIVGALATSPDTVLVYNADDPLCAAIAGRVDNEGTAFGIDEDLHLAQNTVTDAQMCQQCSAMLDYTYRQYGQLGSYRCPVCGFARPALDYAAEGVRLSADGLAFRVRGPAHEAELHAPLSGAYMVYNLLACYVAADAIGLSASVLQRAIDEFDPQNGRLQFFDVQGRSTLLNLAKNPTGFNQNIKLVLQDEGPKAVAFFVNDREADGHDVSWLWDIDFEELAAERDLVVFAGGIRRNDVQVRLKYAGIDAVLIDDARAMFEWLAATSSEARAYLIANYTALPAAQADITNVAADGVDPTREKVSPAQHEGATGNLAAMPRAPIAGNADDADDFGNADGVGDEDGPDDESPLVIAHLFPDLLNLYGDGGNVKVLEQRVRRRGIPVEVLRVHHGEPVDLGGVDLVFLGGGPDREQRLASEDLLGMKDALHGYVEEGGVVLAICGGYQILGHEWLLGEETVEGLGIVDVTTRRAAGGSGNRLVGNIVLRSSAARRPVVGYENHAGRTYLGAGVEYFGEVVSSTGNGNNERDKQDGMRYKRVTGTYLHGPLLPKNPEVADDLIVHALQRRAYRTGQAAPELVPLDDAVELAANAYLCRRLGVK